MAEKVLKDNAIRQAHAQVIFRISNCIDEGVAPVDLPQPLGRGAVAAKNFEKNEFVVEYAGDYVENLKDFDDRLEPYLGADGKLPRCYLFYFKFQDKWRW